MLHKNTTTITTKVQKLEEEESDAGKEWLG